MAVLSHPIPRIKRNTFAKAWIITRREIKDGLRDWRIMTPIFILTLIFPILMDFTAGLAVDWASQYDATIVGERLIPFMLLIVGFFPISFSLVIALETFVGEKERNSIEPLLSMPVTDLELYLGKMLAALMIPMFASYLGITIYLIGLYISLGWLPDLLLLSQMVLLTTAKGLVMVSGAVVVSSQTTSVRASNLLASFIIIPMALLLQAEAIFLFWGLHQIIWFIVAALIVVDVILIRMGIRIFNREEILGKEMDALNLKTIWRDFKGYFLRSPDQATAVNTALPHFNPIRIWRQDIPLLLKMHRLPMLVVVGMLLVGLLGGFLLAPTYPLPSSILDLDGVSTTDLDKISALPGFSFLRVFGHNVRALVLSWLTAIFSFGVASLLLVMIPLALAGYFAGAVNLLGHSPFLFLTVFILPHGIIEIPAAIISTAFALRMGAAFVSPPEKLDVGQGFLLTLADFVKIFVFLVLPMLLLAALIEVELTPRLVTWVYSR
ncbi:MAG: stage II sporulation protein M [Chloroflexota bacterium]